MTSAPLVLRPLSRTTGPIDLGRTLKLASASRVITFTGFSRVIRPFAQARVISFEGDVMSDKFPEPFDPADRQFYTFDLTNVLDASENIASATLQADDGLTIGGTGFDTVVGTKTVGFWLQATDVTMLPQDKQVTLTVTTNSSPARRLQRTGIIEVRQR